MEEVSKETVQNKNVCIFCRLKKKSETCSSATDRGYVSFIQSVKIRKLAIDRKYGDFLDGYLNLSRENVQYHRKCYSEFTNKTLISRLQKRISEPEQSDITDLTNQTIISMLQDEFSSSATPKSQPACHVTNWSLCVICQKEKPNKDHLRKVSVETAAKIEKFAEIDNLLFDRIKDINLVIAQVQHHGLCLIDLERRYTKKTSDAQRKQTAFNDLCAELRMTAGEKVIHNIIYKIREPLDRFITKFLSLLFITIQFNNYNFLGFKTSGRMETFL